MDDKQFLKPIRVVKRVEGTKEFFDTLDDNGEVISTQTIYDPEGYRRFLESMREYEQRNQRTIPDATDW